MPKSTPGQEEIQLPTTHGIFMMPILRQADTECRCGGDELNKAPDLAGRESGHINNYEIVS